MRKYRPLLQKIFERIFIMTDAELFKKITTNMAELFAKKNANYGNSFEKLYADLGPVAGLVSLHNKLDRATNLIKGGKNDFESLEDTFIDLANYAIMNVIELKKREEKKSSDIPQKSFPFNDENVFKFNNGKIIINEDKVTFKAGE